MKKQKIDLDFLKKQKYIHYCLFISFLLLTFFVSSYVYNQRSDLFGIDLSKWNGTMEVMPDVDFIILRCGYTSSQSLEPTLDPMFYEYASLCIEQDIPFGVYYYTLASNEVMAIKEAQFVLETISELDVDLGVFFDIEDSTLLDIDENILNLIVLSFCQEIEVYNYPVGVYASYYWWNNILDIENIPYLRWMALYDSPNYELESYYDIYQYTNTGTIDGYSCDFDFNLLKSKYW